MTCKLCGVALLIGAVGLGAFGYFHHTGCCPLTGAPINQPKTVSPGDNTGSADANLVKSEGGCPHGCCAEQVDEKVVKKEGGCCGQPKEKSDGFFTSLAGKASKDEGGCCEGQCSEGKGCCQDKGNAKKETPVKK